MFARGRKSFASERNLCNKKKKKTFCEGMQISLRKNTKSGEGKSFARERKDLKNIFPPMPCPSIVAKLWKNSFCIAFLLT